MIQLDKKNQSLRLDFSKRSLQKLGRKISKVLPYLLVLALVGLSIWNFIYYYNNELGLAYNDARSHLDIGRRVVEGLKPGLAQLGSVWLPLPHILMIPTIWNNFMWHSGLAGAIPSMISFVVTAMVIYKLLGHFGVGVFGRIFGVVVFISNLNILYLQSTAMTELLLLATMTLGVYELIIWHKNDQLVHLVRSSFWIMLSTLVRYDGWFLFFWAAMLVFFKGFKGGKFKMGEGLFIFFCTLGGLGIILWLLWNGVIFGDPLYFAFGPFSAHAQQTQLDVAGVLQTKHNLPLSILMYWYAMAYNSVLFTVVLGVLGAVALFYDKNIKTPVKIAATALLAPFVFNIIALYLGHSVLFIQGISGNTWFNVRYGVMMMPSFAVFAGYLVHKFKPLRFVFVGLFVFVTIFHIGNKDAVTIDDGRVGSSQKNVSEVSTWLRENTADEPGFILISAASHDAIIFSSKLPMKKYIHEGTGEYWESATVAPDRWAKWIVMRTNDTNDLTFREVSKSDALWKYNLVQSFPFADIYELKEEFKPNAETKATIIQR